MTEQLRHRLTDLAQEVQMVDLSERVHHGDRRIRRRNRLVGVSLAVVLGISVGLAIVTLRPGLRGPDVPIGNPSTATSPSTSPNASPSPAAAVDLRQATFDVPAYPGPWANACPAGRRTFANGDARVSANSTLTMGLSVHGDLDNQAGDEYVVPLLCATEGASTYNGLAVKVGPGTTVTALGGVNVEPNGELLELDQAEPIVMANGTVRVSVLGRYSDQGLRADKQTRGYAYRNGAMTQVDGPTTFVPPTSDVRTLDVNNTTLWFAVGLGDGAGGSVNAYMGFVRITGGAGTATFEKIIDGKLVATVPVTVTMRSKIIVPTGSFETGAVLVDITPADASRYTLVVALHSNDGIGAYDNWTLLTTKAGESVSAIAALTNHVRVSMTVNGTAATRFYQYSDDLTQPRWRLV